MRRRKLRVGLSTGGGDCPGLNAVIRAVVRTAIGTYGMEILGIRDGLTGIIEEPNDVFPVTLADVAAVHESGGTILGTSNKGSPFRQKDQAAATIAQIKKAWKRHRLDAMIAIGGDGTHLMAKSLVSAGLPIVGVPKTIDNDLHGTDLTVGFSTAVEVAAEAASRLRTSADAHNRVMVLEVMGRDGGHIALATGLASGANAVLIPELPFSEDELVRRLLARREAGRAAFLIIAAEGAHQAGGAPTFQDAATGAKSLGGIGTRVAQSLHARTGIDARVTVLGHLQRGGAPNAADRILAARLGARAVELVAQERFGRIVAMSAGALTDFSYKSIADTRRLVDINGVDVATAEAMGINLGRPSAYTAPY